MQKCNEGSVIDTLEMGNNISLYVIFFDVTNIFCNS